MPICIAGMHRSGTSMVARLLNLCGLYLGPESEFRPPGPDNPEGYWENIHFVEINDRLLAHLDAGWDLPPAVCSGWELRPELDPLRKESAELIARFNAHEPWGWKDSRNSLTLPLWMNLIPNLKVLICLRNPLEAAQSLRARNFSSITFGLKLWFAHNQRVLSAVQDEDRVVTHYDSYFYAPRAELRRVLDLLNISASDREIDKACESVSASLRHQSVPTEALAPEVPPEILEYYLELCEQAGPIYQASLRKEDYVPWRLDEENRIIRARDETIARLEDELSALREKSRQNEDLNASLQASVVRLQDESRQREDLNALLQASLVRLRDQLSASREDSRHLLGLYDSLRAEGEQRETIIRARNEAIISIREELAAKARELDQITHSLGWRVLRRYGSLKHRYLLPVYRVLGLSAEPDQKEGPETVFTPQSEEEEGTPICPALERCSELDQRGGTDAALAQPSEVEALRRRIRKLTSAAITADPNPVCVCHGWGLGATTLSYTFLEEEPVEVRLGSPNGPLFTRPDKSGEKTTGEWVTDGTTFFLQDVSDGNPLTEDHTLAEVTLRVRKQEGLDPQGV